MGALSIGMAIVSAVLMPVAAGAVAGTAVTGIAIAGSAAGGLVGAASGSLQIAGTARPNNKKLAIANEAFGLAGGVAAIATGAITAGFGIASAVKGTVSIAGRALRIVSGGFDAVAGTTGELSSDLGLGMTVNRISPKKPVW